MVRFNDLGGSMIELIDPNDNATLKETLRKSPSIRSQHKIIGEWNYNAVADIIDFGVYNAVYNTYTKDVGYNSGKALLDYTSVIEGPDGSFMLDGVTIENTVYNSYYSLYDCFQPIRPNAGVVYPMAPSPIRNNNVSDSINSIIAYPLSINQLDNLPGEDLPFSKAYLPHKNVRYRYWTSACYGADGGYVPGMTGAKDKDGTNLYSSEFNDYKFVLKGNGAGEPYPFAVYNREFYCNLIVVKYQTHLGIPKRFAIDVLQGNNWNEIFNSEDFLNDDRLPARHSNGVLRIFRNASGTWEPMNKDRDHPSELIDFLTEGNIKYLPDGTTKITSFDDEAIKIRGIRLRVLTMNKYNVPFELIELSPRLAVDLTDYTQSFSCVTRIGDGSKALPTANLVIGNGEISLSNADGGFFNDNPDSILYKCLTKNTMIYPYQTFNVDGNDYQVPIKVLYVENWAEAEDYVVSATLNDFMKILQSQKASPVMISTLYKSVPVSFAIQTILQGIGFTNFKFLNGKESSQVDIKYFYADDDKTIAEVLDEIARATQCSIYIDAFNNVVCASKDRVLDKGYDIGDENPDWWFTTEDIDINIEVFNPPAPAEDKPKRVFNITELNYSGDPEQFTDIEAESTYLSNIIGINKTQTDPVNDGEIVYRTKTFLANKAYAGKDVQKLVRKNPLKLAQNKFDLNVISLWSVGGKGTTDENSNDIELFGGPLLSRLVDVDLKDRKISKGGFYSLGNPYKNLNEFLSAKLLDSRLIENNKKLISVDPFSAYRIRPWSGYFRIDQEIIRYNGIQYARGKTKRWIFNDEQLEDFMAGGTVRDVIRPTGRIGLWFDFDTENPDIDNENNIKYKILETGRSQFGTKLQNHQIDKFESNNKDYVNGWEMDVSFFYKTEDLTPGESSDKKNVHNIQKCKSKLVIGSTTSDMIKDYAGLINLTGLIIAGSYGKDLTKKGDKVQDVAKEVKKDIEERELTGEDNFDEVLRIATTGDLMAQGIYKEFDKNFDSMYASFLFLNKKGRVKNESPSSTMAAGMAIHYNKNTGEGYFVELLGTPTDTESDDVASKVVVYRVKKKDGTNRITILDSKSIPGGIMAKEPSWGEIDGFKNLAVRIKKPGQFIVYADNKKILSIDDKKKLTLPSTNDVLLYVRGDTVAIFDKFVASVEPTNLNALFLYDKRTTTFKITDDYYNERSIIKYPSDAIYIEEFGNNINQVQKYKFKYNYAPAAIYEIVDLTPVGAEYFIEDYDLDCFGGEIIVSNKSGRRVALTDGEKNQLGVIGVTLADTNEQKFSVEDFTSELSDASNLKNKILSSRRRNDRVAFSVKSEYIQNSATARKLMEWMIKNAYKEFSLANIEIFSNPLLELTDVVKIYSPRNNMDNSYYTITAIDYSVDSNGPRMLVEVREIG